MNCPECNNPMVKVRAEVTSNLKSGDELQEYDKLTYHCDGDDIWVNTETPIKTRNQ